MKISQSDRTPIGNQDTALVAISDIRKTFSSATFNDSPLFDDVASYTITIAANNDLADIYYPNPSNLKTGNDSLPIALLLPGAKVDKSSYSKYASLVAPDRNIPTIAQDVAIETIARWSGLFLRANVLNDKGTFNYLYSTGNAKDTNVTMTSTAA